MARIWYFVGAGLLRDVEGQRRGTTLNFWKVLLVEHWGESGDWAFLIWMWPAWDALGF